MKKLTKADVVKAATEMRESIAAREREGLRDYFAAHALTGILADPCDTDPRMPNEYAEAAYIFADAMLAARVKP